MKQIEVNFEHPANDGLFQYLRPLWQQSKYPSSISPESIADPYYSLGTHPDLVARLWDEITVKLPTDCRWIVFGVPVLVHPSSGIVFGFAGGTHAYALRLPEKERQEALQSGSELTHTYSGGHKFDLADIGKEWVFCRWLKGEELWCLAAYKFAEKPS